MGYNAVGSMYVDKPHNNKFDSCYLSKNLSFGIIKETRDVLANDANQLEIDIASGLRKRCLRRFEFVCEYRG